MCARSMFALTVLLAACGANPQQPQDSHGNLVHNEGDDENDCTRLQRSLDDAPSEDRACLDASDCELVGVASPPSHALARAAAPRYIAMIDATHGRCDRTPPNAGAYGGPPPVALCRNALCTIDYPAPDATAHSVALSADQRLTKPVTRQHQPSLILR